MRCCRLPVVLAFVIGGSGITSEAFAQQDMPRALLAVSPSADYRQADDLLAQHLGRALGVDLRRDGGFSNYRDLIERVTTDDSGYVARMTPYAFVAAQMLGARLEVLGTYESVVTRTTTYRSYLVLNAKRFEAFPPTVEGVYEYLKALKEPARFVYHDKFSTSSYLLPALWFRSHRIFATEQSVDSLVRIEAMRDAKSSRESVGKVAADQAQLAAVWDATKQEYEHDSSVVFIPLPYTVPNDLLVTPAALPETAKAAIRNAIERSPEIGVADFERWRSIDNAREALYALHELNRVARAAPAPVVVRVTIDEESKHSETATQLDQIVEEVRQAVRLAGTELVLEEKVHQAVDVIWTVRSIHSGAILLESDIQAPRNLRDRLKQEFHISFTPVDGDLTRRVVSLIHSRMHRIRYVWPYDERAPTVIRDVDFSVPTGEPVHVQRVTWVDPDRNAFVPSEWRDTKVVSVDQAKFVFDRKDFIRPDASALDYQDPLSDVAYRVILERPSNESRQSKILAATFVALFLLTGAGAGVDLRNRLRPKTQLVPRTLPEMCAALAARIHRPWSQRALTEADVLACNRPRVEEQIEDLKSQRLVPAAMGGITRFAYSIGAGIPFAKGVCADANRRVELVIDPTRVSNTLRLTALLRLLIGKQLLSPFVGVPLEWEGLNELARAILPDAGPGDILIRREDETVTEFASRHFNRVLDEGMKQLSLLPGSWLVSRRDGRCLAQQHIPLPAHLTIGGSRISSLRLEFNVADEVELPFDPASQTVNCWVLGKLVRATIDQETGSTLSLHLRTVALLLQPGTALNAVVLRLARDIDGSGKKEEGA